MEFEVSVIIPVYNAAKFVRRAVESALQFDCVKEILLIEDGSKDDSLQVCKTLLSESPDRVRLIQHPGGANRGAGETRNVGLLNAQSNFISFLDADDYYLNSRFDKDKEIFNRYADADGTYNALGVTFENDDVKNKFLSLGFSQLTTVTGEVPPEELKDVLLGIHKRARGYFHLDTLTLKKEGQRKIQGFNTELRLHQDTEWIFRMAFSLKIYASEIEKPVAVRWVHPENRITRFISHQSKALMYRHFFSWLKNINVEKKYKKLIKYGYVNHLLSAEETRYGRLKQGLNLIADKNVLSNPKCLKLILHRIAILKKRNKDS